MAYDKIDQQPNPGFQSATEELNFYQDLWDKACQNMAIVAQFEDENPEPTPSAVEVVNEIHDSSSRNLDFRDMLILSNDIDRVFHPERFNEERHPEVAKRSDKAAKSANPVPITTVGKDQDVVVTKDVMDGPALRELSEIKIKLEALERRMHDAYIHGNDKQENSLKKEAENLRDKIEKLCDELSPDKVTNPY